MAVHVPLMLDAQVEARMLMLSSNNILKPADGLPISAPSQDMTIGLFKSDIEKPKEQVIRLPISSSVRAQPGKSCFSMKAVPKTSSRLKNCLRSCSPEQFFDSNETVELLKKAKVDKITVYRAPIFQSASEAVNAYENGKFNLLWPVYLKKADISKVKDADKNAPVREQYMRTTMAVSFSMTICRQISHIRTFRSRGHVSHSIKRMFNDTH
jgi:hypothetical protein